MFRKILGTIMMTIGLFIFIMIAGVDDFDMSIIRFIVIWLLLFGLSVSLIVGGAKMIGIEMENEWKKFRK